MKIIIDGQRLPLDVKITRDILTVLKGVARSQNWNLHYDNVLETVYLQAKSEAGDALALPHRQPTEEATVESTRLLGKTICLDPGHGGSDPGATGPSGSYEKDNTLAIALLLRQKLERNGARVIMTRESDQKAGYPDSTPEEDLAARVAIANQSGASIFLSIHNDGFPHPSASGITTYHYGNPLSVKLATHLQKSLALGLRIKDRGVRFASLYILRYAALPAVSVEVGFISSPEEEILLMSGDGRSLAAESIFQGIAGYYGV